MSKRTTSYDEALIEDLRDPVEAVAYLAASLEEPEDPDAAKLFLMALKNVVTAQVTKEASVKTDLTHSKILEGVIRVIGEHQDHKPKEITETTPLSDLYPSFVPGASAFDHLDRLELIMMIEEGFDIDVPDCFEGTETFATVGELVDLIERVRVFRSSGLVLPALGAAPRPGVGSSEKTILDGISEAQKSFHEGVRGRPGGEARKQQIGVAGFAEMGRKGGLNVSKDRSHMSQIGKMGGTALAKKRKNDQVTRLETHFKNNSLMSMTAGKDAITTADDLIDKYSEVFTVSPRNDKTVHGGGGEPEIALKPGDAVCRVHSGTSGRTLSLRRREGYLVEHCADGYSNVRISKGKVIQVRTSELQPGDAKPLKEFVEAMGRGYKPLITWTLDPAKKYVLHFEDNGQDVLRWLVHGEDVIDSNLQGHIWVGYQVVSPVTIYLCPKIRGKLRQDNERTPAVFNHKVIRIEEVNP